MINIETEQKFNQKFNCLGKRLKTIELVLNSPKLNKVTENTGIKENSLKNYKERIMKKLNKLLKGKKQLKI